ncbi:hypothetical protein EMIHUDRAFT_466286 [Emiliania huxleyi CCMP1516]|uniref:RING-type domain-containing protein n=2 Tax=Emiliania huxleyi TaxID=2903 RepID=A0A0D3HYJ6_EMIH1|nr:hypothetical protein EMIHUDRAFT_466286 [Emiliania huxleyi CCMP1516]EOD04081.1 hypothetical protein EMIHUDRAFT_466286 [Emiliania huxleyi CCMP1516]|eukprot:XP_005756510.1 hypothetical protein EMIHUDRAFT_466286 [Emiliania huxleyi CCMP1516]
MSEDEARTREAAKRQKTEAEKRIVAERCPICWDSPPDQPVTAPCGHTFCRSCIMAALVIRKECPCCRESLSSHRALTHRSDPEVVPRHPEATELQPTAGEARQARQRDTGEARQSAAGEARQRDTGEARQSAAGEARQRDTGEARQSAAGEARQRDAGEVRQCGTPGCFLAAFHAGPCVPEAVWTPRMRTAPVRLQGGEGGGLATAGAPQEATQPPPHARPRPEQPGGGDGSRSFSVGDEVVARGHLGRLVSSGNGAYQVQTAVESRASTSLAAASQQPRPGGPLAAADAGEGAAVVVYFSDVSRWYRGEVTSVGGDGTFGVLYEDGDEEEAVPLEELFHELQAADTAGEARQAWAEGLRLHLSSSSATGYKGVYEHFGRFKAEHSVNGRRARIGTFATAVEAAVAYARTVGEYQPPAHPPPAVAAEAEGLRLHLSSSSSTGYMGVTEPSSGRFRAQHSVGGTEVYLGTFDTVVEAAVAYARAKAGKAGGPERAAEEAGAAEGGEAEGMEVEQAEEAEAEGSAGGEKGETAGEDEEGETAEKEAEAGSACSTASPPPPPPTHREAALATPLATEAEGLRLHLSSSNVTGYMGVTEPSSGRFRAQHRAGGRQVSLGTFATAVEAAVAYARAVGESEGPQEEPGRADPATDPEPAPPPPSAPVPPPPPASTSASVPSAAASAPPEFSVAMRDELLSLPRHRRARRFFTRALREQDELLELYDRREARGGVLHPEAQRRFEQLKAAKAAAARSSSAPADTFSASLGAVAPRARRDSTRIPHFLVSAPVGYHDTPSWVAEAPAWVLAAAAAEGLTLVRSTNTTGFAHVLLPAGANKATPFMLRCAMEEGGARVVGYYASAAEAALVYARRVGPEASAHEHRMGGARLMTAAQALAAAEAEGLTLERPHHNSRRKEARFKYVHLDQDAASRARPYRLVIRGEDKRLLKGGRYATEEQAALEAARYHAACARKN